MIDIEKTTIRLGNRDFEIQSASYLRAKPWKKRFVEEIKPLFESLGELKDMQFDSPADLLKIFPMVEMLFLEAIDKVFEMLISYSPILEAEREYIENNATDKQILIGFQEALKLADPFEMIQLASRKIGRGTIGTL